MANYIEITAEKITDGLIFGEGIRWNGSEIVLSDMIGKRVVKIDPSSGGIETVLEVENQPNGLVCLEDGSLLILSMFDNKVLKLKDGDVSVYADLSHVATGYMGDAVMDTQGNLYVDDVGSRVFHGEPPGPNGRVILVRPNGEISVVLENLAFPNGITISPDGKKFYLNESFKGSVFVYDIEADGGLSGRRLLAELGPVDGMAIDDEGGIWPCLVSGNDIVRLDVDGNVTHKITIPGMNPVSNIIGGPDGKTMYITVKDETKEGEEPFEKIVKGLTKTSIWKASVPFAKIGNARP